MNNIQKYFKYIGIENEGHKRITILVLPFAAFYLHGTGIVGDIYRFLNIDEILREWGYWDEILIGLSILAFLTLSFVGFIIKSFIWVKEGFKK